MTKKNLPTDYWRAKSDERREAKKPPLWDSEITGESGAVYDNAKINGVDKLDPSPPEFTQAELDDYSYLASAWQDDTDPFTRHIDRVGIKL